MAAASASAESSHAPSLVVMGVSGCGKSTVGRRLAASLGRPFVEGDEFHAPENVEKMRAGIALADADREGWLRSLSAVLARARVDGTGAVLACSALKRRYRDMLRQGDPDLLLVFLHGRRDALAARLQSRRDHYMPASLLDSQLAALEPPGDDERALAFDIDADADAIAEEVRRRIGGRSDG
jgi:gluconokinase